MSDYTPDETELLDCYAALAEKFDGLSYDEGMAADGWVPVQTKPTITESEFEDVKAAWGKFASWAWLRGFVRAGGEFVDDPEPTDEELLAGIIRGIDDWQSITSPELLAKYLNTAGVTPPKENN